MCALLHAVAQLQDGQHTQQKRMLFVETYKTDITVARHTTPHTETTKKTGQVVTQVSGRIDFD